MGTARRTPDTVDILAMAPLETDRASAMIRRRRRQILVHSAIYYRAGTSLVSDAVYDTWCHELQRLQASFPAESSQVEHADTFCGFDGTTGFNLPIDEPAVRALAARLIEFAQQLDETEIPRQ